MLSPGSTTNAIAIGAAFLAIVCAQPRALALDNGKYYEPDFEKKLFGRDSLLLEPQEVTATVTALAALAANFPDAGEVGPVLCAKALAIALRLDGTHPAAGRDRSTVLSRRL